MLERSNGISRRIFSPASSEAVDDMVKTTRRTVASVEAVNISDFFDYVADGNNNVTKRLFADIRVLDDSWCIAARGLLDTSNDQRA